MTPQSNPASSPEFGLLLACCAELLQAKPTERVTAALTEPIDWPRTVQLAEHNAVIPHVYARLSTARDLVPNQALAQLRQGYQANARQTLWLTRELFRVLEQLQARGIAALPYKGPALAELVYGNVTQRQFGDIDIFVRAADVPKAKAAVLELGYGHNLRLGVREEQAYLRSGYEYTFDSPLGRNLLELQWQVLPRFYAVDFDMDGLFERAQTLAIGGRTLQTLGAEDMVLVLCVHAAKHAWIQLSWLCELALLAQLQPIRWEMVQQQARRLGVERMVSASFLLAEKLIGAPVPAAFQAQIDHSASLVDQILPILCAGAGLSTESIPYFKLMMESRERRRDRLRFLWRLAVTPGVGEWAAIRLPAPLFPLYHGVRAARLAGRLFSR